MAKCSHCNSCLTVVVLVSNCYLYCSLCRKVYSRNLNNGKLEEVTTQELVERIKSVLGDRIL